MSATGRMFKDEQDNKDEMIQELIEVLEAMDEWASEINDEDSRVPLDIRLRTRAVINKVKG